MKAAFESPDIPGYVYLLEHSRASDGGGSKVDRRGIETYLLAQLAAPVHQLPLSIRGNFGYPLPPLPAEFVHNFHARYAFLKSVSVVVHLIPAAFAR